MGYGVDGLRRTTRSDPEKLCQVVGITLVFVLEGYCAGRVLRRLAGLWLRHLLLRWPYSCILQETFALAESLAPWKRVKLHWAVASWACVAC